ncbi:unnamed protein product [Cylindrotheca closterium]|uniref:UTP23 sensor motif region domain-containing protein n=1 Tax=Cylindrotheca closterium TaxID=2856 RepID=A0AAD2FLJ6_9STRA|nr:unnamed protein product [Cylindrotheca closterium]
MRHGRAKAARKTLQYFHRTIGLKAPYDILLDATMVVAMFQQKILPFKERMDRVLQTTGADGPNHYYILQSAVDELQTIHDKLESKKHIKAEAFGEALKFIWDECTVLDHRKKDQRIGKNEEKKDEGDNETDDASPNEEQAPASVQDDLLHLIKNDETSYIVGTQDEGLLHTLRSKGTVPIVRLANSSVLIIENPSKMSQNHAKGVEEKKWKNSLQDSERKLVTLAHKEKRASKIISSSNSSAPNQRKKKAKGPNPLSCKRKSGAGDKNSKESASKKRRMRAKAKGS